MIVVFFLFCMPVLLAGGMIAARKMKRNHPFSLTCYSNAVLLVTSIVGLYLTSERGYGFLLEFSWTVWLLLILAALNTIFEHLAKFLAFRYYRAAPLQKFNFLPNVWNFTIDILFMHVGFSTLQVIGFICLFTFYTGELLHFYLVRDIQGEEKQ